MHLNRCHIASLLCLLPSLFFAGCTLDPTASPLPSQGVSLRGNVHGGQAPIVGAHVYLLAANTTGYGNASSSLLNAINTGASDSIGAYVTTASDGSFTIGSDYTCTPNTQVYIYALGGNPGAGANSGSGLMAALGNCPGAGSFAATIPYIWVNEVTTIAAAYSFAGFATDATHVSSSGTTLAQTGIANAFANATNLVDLPSGVALTSTPAGNGTVPQAEINTLANILAACVNSTGPSSSPCTTLFTNAQSSGTTGTTPTDTATAAINIAHNPIATVAALYAIPAPTVAFAPVLSSQPNDFTLSIAFTGGGLSSARHLAIDAGGNVWASNYGNATISKLSPLGAAISSSSGYTDSSLNGPDGMAIDSTGNVWVVDSAGSGGTLTEFTSAGAFLGTATDPYFANYIAIDPSGNLWIPNYSSTNNSNVAELSSTGSSIGSYTGSGINSPGPIAIDHSGNVWVGNYGVSGVSKWSNNGTPDANGPYTAGGTGNVSSMAIDSAGDIWSLNFDGSLSGFTSSATAITGSPFHTSSGQSGSGLAIDGQNNLFAITNTFSFGSFTYTYSFLEFSGSGSSLSGSSGYTPPASAYDLAVDGSGNVWIAASNSVVQFVGLGSPVVTPLSAAVANNTLATRP